MKIKLAENKRLISEDKARAAAKRILSVSDESRISVELCYKKMYFLKMLALAARTPFPPKKVPYVLFFDSRIGVGGPTPGVPEYKMTEVPDEAVYPDVYDRKGFEAKYDELINKFILKQYLLKRPELKKEGSDEIYLPYYKCTYNGREVFINAGTGKKNL